MCLCIMWTSLAVSGWLYASGEERPHTTRRIRRGRVMRGFSYSSHAPCRGGGAPGRSVSRASAALVGPRRGAPEPPPPFFEPPPPPENGGPGEHPTPPPEPGLAQTGAGDTGGPRPPRPT